MHLASVFVEHVLTCPDSVTVIGTGAQALAMRRAVEHTLRISLRGVVGCASHEAVPGQAVYVLCAMPKREALASLAQRGIPATSVLDWADLRPLLPALASSCTRPGFGLQPIDEYGATVVPRGADDPVVHHFDRLGAFFADFFRECGHQRPAHLALASALAPSYLALRRLVGLAQDCREKKLLLLSNTPEVGRRQASRLVAHPRLFLRVDDDRWSPVAERLLELERSGDVTDAVVAVLLSVVLDGCDGIGGDTLVALWPALPNVTWFECATVQVEDAYDSLDDGLRRLGWPPFTLPPSDDGQQTTEQARRIGCHAYARSAFQTHGSGRVLFEKPDAVALWGVGDHAERLVRLLEDAGIAVPAVVDPWNTGAVTFCGRPVFSPTDFAHHASAFPRVPVVIVPDESRGAGFGAQCAAFFRSPVSYHTKLLHPAFLARFVALDFHRGVFVSGFPSSGNTIFSAILQWLSDQRPAESPDVQLMRHWVRDHAAFMVTTFAAGMPFGPVEFGRYHSLFDVQIEKMEGNRRVVMHGIPLIHPLLSSVGAGHFCLEADERAWLSANRIRVFHPVRHPLEVLVSTAQKVFFAGTQTTLVPRADQLPGFRADLAHIRLGDAAWLDRHGRELLAMQRAGMVEGPGTLALRYEDLLAGPARVVRRLADWMEVDVEATAIEEFWRAKGLKPINRAGYEAHFNNPTVTKYPDMITPDVWRALANLGYADLLADLGYERLASTAGARAPRHPSSEAVRFADWDAGQRAHISNVPLCGATMVTVTSNDREMIESAHRFFAEPELAPKLGLLTP